MQRLEYTSFFCTRAFPPQVALVTAKVALKAGVGLELEVSDFLQAVADGLVEELVDRTLDEEMLARYVSGKDVAIADVQEMQQNVRDSYEKLKKFMKKIESKRGGDSRDGDGYVDFRKSMQHVANGKGGLVWVRNENVQKWRDSLSTAAPSR